MSASAMTPAQATMCLSFSPGIGAVAYWRLISYFGDAAAVCAAPEKALREVMGLSEKQRRAAVRAASLLPTVRAEEERLAELGGVCICHNQSEYPEKLLHLADPPPILYAAGDVSLLQKRAIAVVGSRAASSYGRRISFTFAQGLARHLVVVSGMALGIDGQAHAGALTAGGKSIGVLGSGLDVPYPPANAKLFADMRERGLLLSEYPLGTPPEAFRFPARNRIIAALGEGIVVVEAAQRSGALITAQMALDIGREVFAVPGQVDSAKSAGCHALLHDGATIALSVDNILAALDGIGARKAAAADREEIILTDEQAAVLALVESYPQSREDILARSRLSAARFAEILIYLELEGLLESVPGDMLRRLPVG
ncbi:MAG TPA: DNA-protecting protein DprA [Desulfobulbaceae bacterium]|nr:DNA-protecting protein DprA [Desulfobulbaceae bacterium]